MPTSRGHFVWCELTTTDTASATDFYRAVIGWRSADAGLPDRQYTILSAGETAMGGIAALPAAACAAGARPGWTGYIGVDDVDSFVQLVRQAGGSVHRDAEDIPGAGRFAIVADPQGACFALFMPLPGMSQPPVAGPAPGLVGWHELHAADRESAFGFYAGLFGWTKTEAIDMGPMGIYQTFATGGPTGDAMAGGMMTKTGTMPISGWLYYFIVDDSSAAAARVKASGGQVLNGPHQVPGGSWIVQCLDPQGGMFAMVGPNAQE